MSGPGGTSTKRDQRRETRRAQFQQRQLERQRERQRQLARQRNQRIAMGVAAFVVVALIGVLVFAMTHQSSGGGTTYTSQHGHYTTPVSGETREGMDCMANEGVAQHIHAYLAIYVNGQQVEVPANTGIVQNQCIYALHVHPGSTNIIHVESPDAHKVYTLGDFFDIWGQPLSKTEVGTQLGDYPADKDHKLVFEVFDDKGNLTTYTGNPLNLPIKAHETIVILYNSPKVTPTPFKDWGSL